MSFYFFKFETISYHDSEVMCGKRGITQKRCYSRVKCNEKGFQRIVHRYKDDRKRSLPSLCGVSINLTRTKAFVFVSNWDRLWTGRHSVLVLPLHWFVWPPFKKIRFVVTKNKEWIKEIWCNPYTHVMFVFECVYFLAECL